MDEGARKQKGQKKLPGRSEKPKGKEMIERRPLKTVVTSPPSYYINERVLLDSYIEKEVKIPEGMDGPMQHETSARCRASRSVKQSSNQYGSFSYKDKMVVSLIFIMGIPILFAGIIHGIPLALDSTNRTDVLRVIDRGKREKQIPWRVNHEHDAIFCLSVYNIKLSRRDGEEQLLLRVPIHEVASTCYIRDDNQHIVSLKFATHPEPSTDDVCHLAVLYCENREISEELCSLIGQCFQIVYKEATVEFLDQKLIEVASSLSVTSSNITTTTRSDNSNSNRSTPHAGRNYFDPNRVSFMSQSQQNLDQGNTATSSSSASRSLPMNRRRKPSRTPSDTEKELLAQYMDKLHTKLTPSELKEFAHLLQASASHMPFPDFCSKLFELYGPDRRYLLSGMRPFIPEKNSHYFETFLEQIRVNGNSSLTESSLSSGGYPQRDRRPLSGATSAHSGHVPDDYDRILQEISGDFSRMEASVDVSTNPDHFMPDT